MFLKSTHQYDKMNYVQEKRDYMAKSSGVIRKITSWKIVLLIQLIASIVFLGIVYRLGILPIRYFLIVVGVAILLWFISFVLTRPGKKKKKKIFGKFVSVLLSILLLFVSLRIAQGDSLLASFTSIGQEVTRISLVVMKDSPYESIDDLDYCTVETSLSLDKANMEEGIKVLEKANPLLDIEKITNIGQLADDLYNGDADAVFVNEAYYAMFENKHENFRYDTRVIWTHEIIEEVSDFSKSVKVLKEPFTVYISGIDTDGDVSTVSRSDVNMIVTVNPKTHQVLMTSIPRDYFVTLADVGMKDKLTHSGLTGTDNTVQTVEDFMDIDINYYVRVNYTSLIKLVDAIGGVTIDVPFSFYSGVDSSYFEKGRQLMDGETAMKYVRERKAFPDGDNDRIHNQQIVLTAIIEKLISPKIITNYTKILDAVEGSFETNMSTRDITSLIQMQIDKKPAWTIIQKQLSGTPERSTEGYYMYGTSIYYTMPDEDSIEENKEYIQQILDGEILEVND